MSLSAEKISDRFIVDNSGPKIIIKNIDESSSNYITLSFTVSDKYSPTKNVEFSINSKKWKKTYPVDGIFDSKSEKFNIKLYVENNDLNSIIIKATDLNNNIGFQRTRF